MKKILVVDDSSTQILLCQSMFEDTAYEVLTAQDVVNARKVISLVIPDLILLDIMMPRISGLEYLKELKADSKTMDIPVVIVSAKNNTEDMQKAKELGAISYINKPIGQSNLMKLVEGLFQSSV